MEDRYEIRGKIGQGGLGSVYRAYDTRMNREVAIKRISSDAEDKEHLEESTRQLMKEAGALASLQHPHIVTVYDVGSDEDGPFVVMELISGKTLDELVERAPLTWPDFRELAMQSQEALIAAQELELVHRDLKPGNVMLNWLPSGKFQVKVVDFGLAKMTPKPSLQTLDQGDSVFGSIFFMAPEQFERKPLDFRTDMYAIGCVYYHALTGVYPFDGETGPQVMAAHLQHKVTPIQYVRPEIPLWVCDWIMWHINREPDDRPASAREALHVFLQNDPIQNPPMSTGNPPSSASELPKRPRLIIPGAAEPVPEPVPVEPAEAPVVMKGTPAPLAETAPVKVKTHTSLQPHSQPGTAPVPEAVAVPEETALPGDATESVPVAAPVSSAGRLLTGPAVEAVANGPVATTPVAGIAPTRPGTTVAAPAAAAPKKKKKSSLNNASKMALAAVLGILVVVLGVYLLKLSGENKKTAMLNEMLTEAAKGDATEVPVNSLKLGLLLEEAASVGASEHRQTVYKALFLAKANDGTDVDARIAEFATTRPMIPDVREVLIRDVLRQRKNPAIVPTLMKFASGTEDVRAAAAALLASQFMVGDAEFDQFLHVIQFTPHLPVRQAAEEAMGNIIQKSSRREDLGNRLAIAYGSSVDDDVRHTLLRLLGRAGGEKALEVVSSALADSEQKNKIAAIVALGAWGDEQGFPRLMEFLSSSTDDGLRGRAFDSALRYISSPSKSGGEGEERLWTELAAEARTSDEQLKLVQSLATREYPWALALLEKFTDPSGYDRVINQAERAYDHLAARLKVQEADRSGNGPDEEAPQGE